MALLIKMTDQQVKNSRTQCTDQCNTHWCDDAHLLFNASRPDMTAFAATPKPHSIRRRMASDSFGRGQRGGSLRNLRPPLIMFHASESSIVSFTSWQLTVLEDLSLITFCAGCYTRLSLLCASCHLWAKRTADNIHSD